MHVLVLRPGSCDMAQPPLSGVFIFMHSSRPIRMILTCTNCRGIVVFSARYGRPKLTVLLSDYVLYLVWDGIGGVLAIILGRGSRALVDLTVLRAHECTSDLRLACLRNQ